MITRDQIKQRVNKILSLSYSMCSIQIEDGLRFVEDLGADSLDLISTIMDCEREFNIQIEDMKIKEIKTIGDLYDLIEDNFTERGV